MKTAKLLPFLSLWILPHAGSAATVFGPILYRQVSDSPFRAGIESGTVYLENFEDGQLNTPGVSARDGGIREDQGVDIDDGMLDGLGRNMVWVGPNGTLPDLGDPWKIEISFTPDAILGYPTFAGVVLPGWTGLPPNIPAAKRFGAYDAAGNDLLSGGLIVDMVHLPAGTSYYSSEGDQFVGIYNETGISRIILSNYSFDHLQYGWAIPEPGTVTLSGLAAALLLARRWRSTSRK